MKLQETHWWRNEMKIFLAGLFFTLMSSFAFAQTTQFPAYVHGKTGATTPLTNQCIPVVNSAGTATNTVCSNYPAAIGAAALAGGTGSSPQSLKGVNTLPPCSLGTTGTLTVDFNTFTTCNPDTLVVGPLTGNVTLSSPANLPSGGGLWFGFRVIHDNSDAFTVTLAANGNFFTPDGTQVTLPGSGGSVDYVRCYGYSSTEADCAGPGAVLANFVQLQTIQPLTLTGDGFNTTTCSGNPCSVVTATASTNYFAVFARACTSGGCFPSGTPVSEGSVTVTASSGSAPTCTGATSAFYSGTNGLSTDVFVCKPSSVVAGAQYTFTFTPTSGMFYPIIAVKGFSGTAASANDLGKGASNTGTASTSPSVTTGSPLTAGNGVVGICNGSGGSLAATGGTTALATTNATNDVVLWKPAPSTSAVTLQASQPSGYFTCSGMAFK